MRTDLNMRKGKMVAQGSHASMKVFFDKMHRGDKTFSGDTIFYTQFTPEMIEWAFGDKFTKICVGCDSLDALLSILRQVDEAGIPCALIEDSGTTEFKEACDACSGSGEQYGGTHSWPCTKCNGSGKVNKPTFTCLAIGPDDAEKIDKITGHLKLL